jgi:hypothetical protein
MNRNKSSKYTRDDRKYISAQIENLKNDDYGIAIFDILVQDPANIFTINSNGTHLNMSVLSDQTLDNVTKYLKRVNREKKTEINIDTDVIPSISQQPKDRAYKLSNYEQNIIKQRDLKKMMNADKEYEPLKFNAKKKTTGATEPAKITKTTKTAKATKAIKETKPTKKSPTKKSPTKKSPSTKNAYQSK